MSKITTVYDTLLSSLATLFSSKTRIFDAYSLTDNPEHILRDGYGLAYLGNEGLSGEFNSQVDSHTFEIPLTREVVHTEDQVDRFDTQAKGIIEDAYSVRFMLSEYDKLGIPTSIDQIVLGSTTGITRVNVGQSKFITLSISFTVQVTEALPC